MRKKKKKIFVLDTNVILHDPNCVQEFEDNDIILPITVIEELDNFKKGNETINFNAREFARALDAMAADSSFQEGFTMGEGKGKIFIELESEFHEDLRNSFSTQKHDHRILNIAYCAQEKFPKNQVMVVTKDVNLRMKAKSVGLMAKDYTTDHVKDISSIYKGSRVIEHIAGELIENLYQNGESDEIESLQLEAPFKPHEFAILKGENKSALCVYDPNFDRLVHIKKKQAYGITPRNAEQVFALNALTNPDIKLVSLSGKAGTGKTLLALAAGLELRKTFRQIFIARPVVPLSFRDIGFLPGDIKSKLDPYMQPLFDNLGVIQNQFGEADSRHQDIKKFLEDEKLLITPLAYIRGRSLVKVFFIVDEAQNLTPHEVKTIITRAGEGTKIVFTGDIFQIDHPYLDSHANGLSYLIERMQGQNIYAHINMEKGERSELSEIASNLL